MKITFEINDPMDLWALLKYVQTLDTVKMSLVSDSTLTQEVEQTKTIGDFIGLAPTIDTNAFKTHLEASREEWTRPIS